MFFNVNFFINASKCKYTVMNLPPAVNCLSQHPMQIKHTELYMLVLLLGLFWQIHDVSNKDLGYVIHFYGHAWVSDTAQRAYLHHFPMTYMKGEIILSLELTNW